MYLTERTGAHRSGNPWKGKWIPPPFLFFWDTRLTGPMGGAGSYPPSPLRKHGLV